MLSSALDLGDWDYKIKPNWLTAERADFARGKQMGKTFYSLRKLYPLAPVAEFSYP